MRHYILTRIEAIQQELETLKQMLIAQNQSDRRTIRLRGIWKGVHISDQLLEEAERLLISKEFRDKE
ncbi:MAG: hypothetical protein C4288_07695 [Leptolyngbya sp. ERB_1_1]